MRVLVTGANGFLGGHVMAALAARGDEAVATSLAECDIRNADTVSNLIRTTSPDAVLHLAAQASVARSFADPVETFETNVLGTVALLEAVRRHAPRARVVVASSAEVYGAVQPEQLPLRESAPLAPVSPYAASKLAQEEVSRQYHRAFGLDVVVLRGFNAIGPGQSIDFALPAFAAQLAAIVRGHAEPVLRVGNLSAERDLTDVRDVARAYALVTERGAAGEVYNVSSGRTVSIDGALRRLIAISGLEVEVQVDPDRLRPVDVPRLVGCAEKVHAATGWSPEIPLDRTLKDLLDRHLESS